MVKFDWTAVRAVLSNCGIDKDASQIKNHFMDLGKKLRAWEFLIGRTSVGTDPTIGAVVVRDDVWDAFLQVSVLIGSLCTALLLSSIVNVDYLCVMNCTCCRNTTESSSHSASGYLPMWRSCRSRFMEDTQQGR